MFTELTSVWQRIRRNESALLVQVSEAMLLKKSVVTAAISRALRSYNNQTTASMTDVNVWTQSSRIEVRPTGLPSLLTQSLTALTYVVWSRLSTRCQLWWPPIYTWKISRSKINSKSDEKLFNKILTCPNHIQRTLLPPPTAQKLQS